MTAQKRHKSPSLLSPATFSCHGDLIYAAGNFHTSGEMQTFELLPFLSAPVAVAPAAFGAEIHDRGMSVPAAVV